MADEQIIAADDGAALDPVAALQKATVEAKAAVASKRDAREAINLQIEGLRLQARALTDEINAIEDTLPPQKFTGKVTSIKIGS